ncbi:unnamed protein product, partial [Heterosigma akashiwo]
GGHGTVTGQRAPQPEPRAAGVWPAPRGLRHQVQQEQRFRIRKGQCHKVSCRSGRRRREEKPREFRLQKIAGAQPAACRRHLL